MYMFVKQIIKLSGFSIVKGGFVIGLMTFYVHLYKKQYWTFLKMCEAYMLKLLA